MLAKLSMALTSEGEPITYRKASRLQGVLMKQISTDYAAKLHEQSVHPYSQTVIPQQDGSAVWIVHALNSEAEEQLVEPLLSPDFTSFQFTGGASVQVVDKQVQRISEEDLLSESRTGGRSISPVLSFLTPTAFKQNGVYTLFPEPFLVYQSIINKINTVSDLSISGGEELITALAQSTLVKRYRLHTMVYPGEAVTIPGFVGNLTYQIRGDEELQSLAGYVLRFGTFAGIGIKTGMGMGGMTLSMEETGQGRKTR